MKKLTSMLLAVLIGCSFSLSAFAQESIAAKPQFIVAGYSVEDIGDDIIFEELAEVEANKYKAGFNGLLSAKVTHTYRLKSSNEIIGRVESYATFSSQLGSNICYMEDYGFNIILEDKNQLFFSSQDPTIKQNTGIGTKYSQYTHSYKVTNYLNRKITKTMWIKCDSYGGLPTSGNRTSTGTIN